MKNSPAIFLSVLIPTWNRFESVLEAVKSVKPVTDQIEIVVVDDGSDELLARRLCDGLKVFPHVKLFRNIANQGMVKNWNRCIAHALGKWMGILCDDDIYQPGAIDRVMNIIKNCSEPALISQDLSIKKELVHCPAGKETVKGLKLPIISGNFWHKKIVEELGGFNERFIYSADAEYWYRIASRFPVVKVKAPFAVYKRHKNNYMWSTWRKPDFLEQTKILGHAVASYFCDDDKCARQAVDDGLWDTVMTILETSFLTKGMSDIFSRYFQEGCLRATNLKRKAGLIKALATAVALRFKSSIGGFLK